MDTTYTTTSAAETASLSPAVLLVTLALIVLLFAALWRVFTKAGVPGWKALIPVYNAYVLLKIVGRPGWWLLLLLIPYVNIVFSIILSLDLAKSFGRGPLFAIFGLMLTPVGYFMLAFNKDQYQGPSVGQQAAQPEQPQQPDQPASPIVNG